MVYILSQENSESVSIPQTFGIKSNLLQRTKIVVAHTHTQKHARVSIQNKKNLNGCLWKERTH